ncbi:MAG TPA: nitroreductase family protein [Gordonia sp. (in: high G+C Gram-positive bacteria)]|uniref:nitroreductase family protein n=1 Tax=unclassified Gordonia (in: high G+C Gram-positive bacteria) TaxID=2657482 RepID=UPI000FAF4C5C|nr:MULTISPECIES: nitroreductase family protein [unclassified Gordonia (in: high G+C Gram-positive bacteria)]RUP38021.1 MAG: nitroreductase family protein [Gordonia sp. (in: high G+C Gram-positive bacteria)]HNP58164.1 nitroreductase family protein [Gordonia sp. (in: high G+C Gram-positive bacteria)]HRC51047.1 nitroreductase family protein [Gordonia sp. (in: high G+C Gram-positive bacteria)]
MTELLPLDPDQLLTTTRSVRKRLDLDRPVPLDVIREALEVALQAPTGSNSQGWHWIVIDDAEKKRQIADLYRKSFAPYIAAQGNRDETGQRVASSASYLAEVLDQVPVFVIGAIHVGRAGLPEGNQAGLWGSLLPGAWSLQLALRARGIGSAWTTLHLVYEKEVAQILGIPDTIAQGVLLPVAYYTGEGFNPAPRRPLEDVLHINGW